MFNINQIIQSGGLLIIALFIFSEVGFFLGFILPGDTLLVAAGIYAMQGKLPLLAVIIVGALAAMAGDSTAYVIGRKLGRRVFERSHNFLFNDSHIKTSEKFFNKYGKRSVLISHCVPYVRTFLPLLAGVGAMPYWQFLVFDAIGDSIWAIAVTLFGYYVGSKIPNINSYLMPLFVLVIAISVIPTLIPLYLKLRKRKRTKAKDI